MIRRAFVFVALSLAATAFAADWQAESTSALASADPALIASLEASRPMTARNGSLRFFDQALYQPEAHPWLVQQVADNSLDPKLRHAYANAFVRGLAEVEGPSIYKDAWVELSQTVQDRDTRKLLVASFAKADADTMRRGLGAAMADTDAEIRALAAGTAALHASGDELTGHLVQLVRDEAPEARAAAIRALGVLRVSDALPAAERLIADGDAAVRLQALRAVQRLAPQRVKASAERLQQDADAGVRRFAESLLTP